MAGTLSGKVYTLNMPLPSPRHIAPAGTPLRLTTLIAAAFDQLAGRDAPQELATAIQTRYDVPHCLTVSSGRAALTLIFRSLARLANDPRRNEIIVPGYTCYSVAAAAVLAGLRLRIVDIDPQTLSYDRTLLDELDSSQALAIVSANLYGLPNELDYLEKFARTRDIFMVDDSAQAMHATLNGRPVGCFGDVGIYSFDKGKNITSLQGGAIVTRDAAIAAALAETLGTLPGEAALATSATFIKLIAYTLLLHPRLYWIPANIPALGLGITVYTTDMPMHRLSRFAASLVLRQFAAIDTITASRIRVATELRQAVAGSTTLKPVAPIAGSRPVYLRLPCLAEPGVDRAALIGALNRAGIGATGSFPQALGDLAEIAEHIRIEGDTLRGARSVADRIVTLPTLAHMRAMDVRRVEETVRASTQPAGLQRICK